ncbi:MAG: winged helix DNA-binding domain-containing protein [Anaerolineae bacterium]|nr:winged helix DNA-binding domain-containing protein [Anaerolineae bacterium]
MCYLDEAFSHTENQVMSLQTPTTPVPLKASRALALYAQRLHRLPESSSLPDAIYAVVERLGCVQIDTLHMVARSQYLVLWSRLGPYRRDQFDALIFDPDQRRLFEYWKKAASIIPLKHYRYSLPKMRGFRDSPSSWWRARFLADEENVRLLKTVRQRLTEEGPLRAADFDYTGPRRDSWWDWKPAKHALEYLYNTGEAMIGNRINFQRVYDLRDRVLPDWVDQTEPTPEEAHRFHVEQAVKALGICEPLQAADYAYMKRTAARPTLQALLKEGILLEVEGEDVNGDPIHMVLHRDSLADLQRALDGALQAQHTTFLSPFDSLFWARGRDERIWNFRQALEAYKREPDRIWGYFCLPILHRDRLVGRFDPKLVRKTGTLYLRALHLEPGIEPDDELVADVAEAMRSFLAFHQASHLVIEDKGHAEFRRKLQALF